MMQWCDHRAQRTKTEIAGRGRQIGAMAASSGVRPHVSLLSLEDDNNGERTIAKRVASHRRPPPVASDRPTELNRFSVVSACRETCSGAVRLLRAENMPTEIPEAPVPTPDHHHHHRHRQCTTDAAFKRRPHLLQPHLTFVLSPPSSSSSVVVAVVVCTEQPLRCRRVDITGAGPSSSCLFFFLFFVPGSNNAAAAAVAVFFPLRFLL
ncbi:hypothetical protein NL676_004272 [Syzygium grande]|nr:hypothetical protein NL676_004272 [Syzygium grande]